MWVLKKSFHFEASHQLRHHDGKCARLHGHSWTGEIEVEGNMLVQSGPKQNMLIDYGDLKKIIDPLVEELDHSHLNVIMNDDMPTSEMLCVWMWNRLSKKFPIDGVFLKAITINETCTTECRYTA